MDGDGMQEIMHTFTQSLRFTVYYMATIVRAL